MAHDCDNCLHNPSKDALIAQFQWTVKDWPTEALRILFRMIDLATELKRVLQEDRDAKRK